MKLIVAVTQDWGIGFENKLLVRIPEDMKRFRRLTRNRVVVMGRKTFESLPGAQPLKDRENIILSRDRALAVPGALVYHTVDELLEGLARYREEEIFVIGGQLVYERLLPHCTEAFVTKVTAPALLPADRFFPNLDALPRWHLAEEGPQEVWEDLLYSFCRYERVKSTDESC